MTLYNVVANVSGEPARIQQRDSITEFSRGEAESFQRSLRLSGFDRVDIIEATGKPPDTITAPTSKPDMQIKPTSSIQIVQDVTTGQNVPYGESTQFTEEQKSISQKQNLYSSPNAKSSEEVQTEFIKNVQKAVEERKISSSSAQSLIQNYVNPNARQVGYTDEGGTYNIPLSAEYSSGFSSGLSQPTGKEKAEDIFKTFRRQIIDLGDLPENSKLNVGGKAYSIGGGYYSPEEFAQKLIKENRINRVEYTKDLPTFVYTSGDVTRNPIGVIYYGAYPVIQVSDELPSIEEAKSKGISPYFTKTSILGHELIHSIHPDWTEGQVSEKQKELTDKGKWFAKSGIEEKELLPGNLRVIAGQSVYAQYQNDLANYNEKQNINSQSQSIFASPNDLLPKSIEGGTYTKEQLDTSQGISRKASELSFQAQFRTKDPIERQFLESKAALYGGAGFIATIAEHPFESGKGIIKSFIRPDIALKQTTEGLQVSSGKTIGEIGASLLLFRGGGMAMEKFASGELSLTSTYPASGKINEMISSKFNIPKTSASFEMMYSKTGGFPIDKSFKFEPSPFIKENTPLYPKSPIPELSQDEFGSFSKVSPQEYPQYNLYGKPIPKSELEIYRNVPLKNIPEVSSDVFSRPNPQQQIYPDIIQYKKGLTYEPIVETTPLYSELKGYEIRHEEIPYKTEPRMTIPRRYILNQEPKITLAEGYGIREPQKSLIDLGFAESISTKEKIKLQQKQSEFPEFSRPQKITRFTATYEKPKGLPNEDIPQLFTYKGSALNPPRYPPNPNENLGIDYLSEIELANEPLFDIDVTGGRYRGRGEYKPPIEELRVGDFQEPFSRVKSRAIPTRISTSRQKDNQRQEQIQQPISENLLRQSPIPIFQLTPTQIPIINTIPKSKARNPQIPIFKPTQTQIPSQIPIQIPETLSIPILMPPPETPIRIKPPKTPTPDFPKIPPPTIILPNLKGFKEPSSFAQSPRGKRKGGYTSSLIAEEYNIKTKIPYKQLAKKTFNPLQIRPLLSSFNPQKSKGKRK